MKDNVDKNWADDMKYAYLIICAIFLCSCNDRLAVSIDAEMSSGVDASNVKICFDELSCIVPNTVKAFADGGLLILHDQNNAKQHFAIVDNDGKVLYFKSKTRSNYSALLEKAVFTFIGFILSIVGFWGHHLMNSMFQRTRLLKELRYVIDNNNSREASEWLEELKMLDLRAITISLLSKRFADIDSELFENKITRTQRVDRMLGAVKKIL